MQKSITRRFMILFLIVIRTLFWFRLSEICDMGVWALENAYFSNVSKADYDGVPALVHKQFPG
jgi:hypothetical protein